MASNHRRKVIVAEADRDCRRVPLSQIGFYPENQKPPHMHDIAFGICTHMTSVRPYMNVCLVKVPEKEKEAWRHANYNLYKHNPLLANCDTQDMNYACLTCTHFVGAQKLIAEGNRTYMNTKDGRRLELVKGDEEGKAIQAYGVKAVIYSEDLWYDDAARRALVADNANQEAVVERFSRRSRSCPILHGRIGHTYDG